MASISPALERRLVAAGWQMNSPENVLALPGDEATFDTMAGALPIHRGSHPGYSRDVKMLLAPLEAAFRTMSDKDLRIAVAAIEGEMGARLRARRYYKYVR